MEQKGSNDNVKASGGSSVFDLGSETPFAASPEKLAAIADPSFMSDAFLRDGIVNGKIRIIDVGPAYQGLYIILGNKFLEFDPADPLCVNPFKAITEGDLGDE